ncbi:serine/threonine-protein kinase [Nocardia xishanensis]|uniref:serine/threonine-protein kinase n=1 Tax=Nocardia xishanensis TaxID=238964 RepID=UPI0008376CC3|nr:serine/threonine-protein kinase [Nocardia xishanensis]
MTTQRRLEVGSEFGPYRLVRLIGRGGMGEVFEAYDTGKDRVVAIKVLPERLAEDPVYRERFRRESHAAARLKEPHVIPIHDYGEIDGHLFIDMRLVEGENLRAVLRERAPLEPAAAVELIRQVAAALDAAHGDDLVHRDIKPDNILTTPDGFAYLVDFGIAHSSTAEGLTADGSAIGSFHYMSPERFSSRVVTEAADIYALGCVLYECLTGARPFPADTDGEIMRAHMVEPPPRPSRLRSEIPTAMDTVIVKALAKDPAARYASAGEFASAAQEALQGKVAVPEVLPTQEASTGDDTVTSAEAVVPQGATAARGPELPDGGPRIRPLAEDAGGARTPEPPKRTLRRTARRLAVPALIAAVILAAATVLVAWVASGRPADGTAVPDRAALNPDDVDLVASAGSIGYKRANCVHREPDPATTALVSCDANDRTGAPAARLFRFRTLDGLRDYYRHFVIEAYGATNCPNDPPGDDGPLVVNGKPTGRDACLTSRADDPATPEPVLAVADEDQLALGLYIWPGPGDQPTRDYIASHHLYHFLPKEKTVDPDFFTAADRRVLDHLTGDYGPSTCKHMDLPAGSAAEAAIHCATRRGDPAPTFFGFPDHRSMSLGYQAGLGQVSGHACGGGGGADDVWRKSTGPVGRFFCDTDENATLGARPCLLAVHDEFRLMIDVCASAKDDPDGAVNSEADLLGWFRTNFG